MRYGGHSCLVAAAVPCMALCSCPFCSARTRRSAATQADATPSPEQLVHHAALRGIQCNQQARERSCISISMWLIIDHGPRRCRPKELTLQPVWPWIHTQWTFKPVHRTCTGCSKFSIEEAYWLTRSCTLLSRLAVFDGGTRSHLVPRFCNLWAFARLFAWFALHSSMHERTCM